MINVHKNAADLLAVNMLKSYETLPAETERWHVRFLHNSMEQVHQHMKRSTKPAMGFQSFNTARRTSRGIAARNMMRLMRYCRIFNVARRWNC
ncbi:MAG: DDE-type integrase/transposase/recombinase [Lyngbya sp. HA4199-MV5]|nr:DDE-type integrase/transposase/recombinase [Stenomitos rutilans HA7619-LM2]MBW4694666.1 DDE-type integrase/transposase/recombinase [Lyngbya sp. HA4199-MV5]